MPSPPLRDRFFTPKVAHAIVSPSAIVATGAGAAAGILVGLGPIGAVIGGAVFLAGRIAVAVPRAHKVRIDPFTLNEPWKRLVRDAVAARSQYHDSIRATRPGPLRDRLDEIGARIDEGVEKCWEIGRAGNALAQARRRIQVPDVQRELARLGDPTTPMSEQTAAALRAQLETAQRMDDTISQARDRLRLLNARLAEAVSRSTELSVSSEGEGQLDQVGRDVTSINRDMEALRQALEVTNQVGGTAT
jgi:hypothetical protein